MLFSGNIRGAVFLEAQEHAVRSSRSWGPSIRAALKPSVKNNDRQKPARRVFVS